MKHFVGLPAIVNHLINIDNLIVGARKTQGLLGKIQEVQSEIASGASIAVRESRDPQRIVAHFGQIRKKLTSAITLAGTESTEQHSTVLGQVCDAFDDVVARIGSIYISSWDTEFARCLDKLKRSVFPGGEADEANGASPQAVLIELKAV
jgi:hypothetical protein